uniref:OK/SW-CL.68 n=1 Tax=Homo sapiens TaxID=9606 RepID=Q8NI73_HUMAN|nr:OK/SW-CL.68 [Homo sapiens]
MLCGNIYPIDHPILMCLWLSDQLQNNCVVILCPKLLINFYLQIEKEGPCKENGK